MDSLPINGDMISVLVNYSIDEDRFIEVTLRSRKSYIGLALETNIGEYEDGDLVIVPIASGYRDVDTNELLITTNHSSVFRDAGLSLSDSAIVVPPGEVVSARTFVPEIYN